MRILVTGGAGFIGSHLAEKLLERSHEVICLDNFNDFYDPEIKKRNMESALCCGGASVITGDILDEEILGKVFEQELDAVIHLAACTGVRQSIDRPEHYAEVNVMGTLNLLERCRDFKVPKFVFASSSCVYASESTTPLSEDRVELLPLSPYAASKVAGEALCHTYHHLFGIDAFVIRPFTVYGPRQRPDMAISVFAHQLKKGHPVRIFGDGRSSRDYTYISDIVDGMVAGVERCEGFKVINLGAASPTCLNDLVDTLSRRLNIQPEIEYAQHQKGDVENSFADIGLARKILGYEPKVGLEEGIDKYCEWLEHELEGARS